MEWLNSLMLSLSRLRDASSSSALLLLVRLQSSFILVLFLFVVCALAYVTYASVTLLSCCKLVGRDRHAAMAPGSPGTRGHDVCGAWAVGTVREAVTERSGESRAGPKARPRVRHRGCLLSLVHVLRAPDCLLTVFSPPNSYQVRNGHHAGQWVLAHVRRDFGAHSLILSGGGQHYLWASGHFILLVCSLRFFLSKLMFGSPSPWWYKRAYMHHWRCMCGVLRRGS